MKNLTLFFLIMSLGMAYSMFFGDHMTFGYQDTKAKVSIKVSYLNDTSKAYEIIADANKSIIISQQYSWASDNTTRSNLQGYSVDEGPFKDIPRGSDGNFTFKLDTNSNHSVIFLAKPQFRLVISGTDQVDFSPPSPTKDRWFDANSNVQFIVPYVILSKDENIRKQLSGWSTDGSYINVISRQESGFYKSPIIHLSSSQKISLEYTTQYYIKVISNFGRALGTGWYDSGTIVNVSVIPGDDLLEGHVFSGWQGSKIGNTNQESISVLSDSPKILVANWDVDYTNLSIIGLIVIALLVLLTIYQKRRIQSKR